MRKKIGLFLLYAAVVALLPALALPLGGSGAKEETDTPPNVTQSANGVTFEILDDSTGNVFAVSLREYLIGALACEMPVSFEPEALKAQVVALHTYALYMQQNPTGAAALAGADFSVDTAANRGYMPESGRVAYFGDNYTAGEQKLEQAVDAAIDYILTYSAQPIAACFHAISSGTTESSEVMFGTALPYLVAVDSAADRDSAGYSSETVLTSFDFSDLMSVYDPLFTVVGEPESWIGEVIYSTSGTVTAISVCGRQYKGSELRAALSLRSSCFNVTYAEGEFTFTVSGYGHGVGMSQYGANSLALRGESFDAILSHYYPGTTLSDSGA